MRTIIAAAVLAAGAGTGVSAATLTYDFDYVFTGGSYSEECSPALQSTCADEDPDFQSIYGDRVLSGAFQTETGPWGDRTAYYNADLRAPGLSVPEVYSGVTGQTDFNDGSGRYTIGLLPFGQVDLSFDDDGGGSAIFRLRETDVGYTADISRDFTIVDFTVSGLPGQDSPEVAAVPLPASAPLLAIALGGMAWMRRRQG